MPGEDVPSHPACWTPLTTLNPTDRVLATLPANSHPARRKATTFPTERRHPGLFVADLSLSRPEPNKSKVGDCYRFLLMQRAVSGQKLLLHNSRFRKD